MEKKTALKILKELHDKSLFAERTALETLIPELKKSDIDDEKIRKELIDFVKSRLAGFPQCEQFIDWLEKQGEQKQEWSEEDKDFMYDTLSNLTELKDRYGEGYGRVGKCIDWLRTLKERYTWKPSDEQMSVLKEQCVCKKSTVAGAVLCELFHDLKKLTEE